MKQRLYSILLVLLAITPFIELANASLLRDNIILGNIGQIYKGLIILLVFFILTKKERAFYLLALAVGGLFSLLHYIITPTHSLAFFVNDLLFVIKVTYIIPLSFLLVDISEKYIAIVSSIAWLTIVANIVIGVFGFGHTQYALGYGFKGFFFSGNEMALTLMVTSALILYLLYKNKHLTPAILFSLALIVIGPVQGMKSLIFGLPLIAIVVPALNYKGLLLSKVRQISKKQLALVVSGILVLMISAVSLLYLISPQFFVRFGEITARSGIVGAVLSERNKYLNYGLQMYAHDFSLVQKVIGAGYSQAQNGMSKYLNHPKTIEMDPFDLFFSFGILVLGYYVIWLISITSFAKQKNSSANFTTFINILLFILSIITGHVVYSTFLITYWAMANALGQRKYTQKIFFLGSTASGGISTYMKETVKNASGSNITILPTHVDGPLINTIFAFITSYAKLSLVLLLCIIRGEETIIHLHMSTKGSFVRKVVLLGTLRWFSDKTFLHLHSGMSVEYFSKVGKSALGKMLLSAVFKTSDGVFVVSQSLFNDITTYFKKNSISIVKNRWHVLPNAIALPTPLPKPNVFQAGNKLHILIVSRLNEVKNLVIVPKIASLLHKHHVNFSITIVGDGPDKARIQAAITNEDMDEYVKLIGHIPYEKLGKYYKDAHVFLLPSKFESFGLVVLEAYLYGIPAVTSDVGGLKDIVVDAVTGYRCQPNDVEEFTEVLEVLAHDSEKMALLSKNAQELVQDYGYKQHIEKLIKIYER